MTRDVSDVTNRKSGLRFLRKVSELSFAAGRRRLTFACMPRPCGGCARVEGGRDGKFSLKRWYLSPYVEKPLNSKVIKSFVPELRSRQVFSCFGIPMLSIYVRYRHYERFPYRYEYVYFTYSYLAMLHVEQQQ